MSTTVIERPAPVSFTMNEIRYVFQSTDTTAPGFYLQVDLFVKIGITFTSIKKFNFKPNTDGKTYLSISDRLNSRTAYQLPSTTLPTTAANSQLVEFYIHFREITTATPYPAWVATESAHERISLKGGIERQKNSRNNYFLYQAANKRFFTWQPTNRFISPTQLCFLSVYATGAGFKLKIEVTKIDGTTATRTDILDLSAAKFWHINISPTILNVSGISGGASVMYYQVSLLNAADAIIYNPYRLYLEYRPEYITYDIAFHNSLGGVDTIKVRGDVTWSIDRQIQEAEGAFSQTDWSDTVKPSETQHSAIYKRDVYKGDIGFLRTADGLMRSPQEALVEILMSTSIYQWLDSRWVQIIGIQKGIDLRNSTDKKFSFPIEWQLPFNNAVFTPKDIALGLGNDTEIY